MKIDIRSLSEDELCEFFVKKVLIVTEVNKFMNGFGKSPHIHLII